MHQNRTLIRGDNLTEMRKIPDACIDLIATDPPFNSKRDYFVPYRDKHGREPDTLIRAFTDTWTWGEAAEETYDTLIVDVGGQVGNTIEGLRQFLNETPMMAYLVMMAVRIVEMHRILKNTSSLYLHCDPTASHYLKIILDAVFGTNNFRNEIVWCYRGAGYPKKDFGRRHDIIFRYSKDAQYIFNLDDVREEYADATKERFKHYIGNKRQGSDFGLQKLNPLGKHPDDWWQIQPIAPSAKERTGYPTQKPMELYKRIIKASSNPGDLILDPFCGCGTTLMAAEDLNRNTAEEQHRKWIGIDLTYLAIGAVEQQIEKHFPQLRDSITITGTPENVDQALALAHTDPNGFEEWSVTHVLKFKSNAKKGADGGIDGTYKFPIGRVRGRQAYGKAVAQVKGGNYIPGHIRDFRTAMQDANADLGVFVVTTPPTDNMRALAAKAKTYKHPSYEFKCPRLQIYEIQNYFRGNMPTLPLGDRTVL